jgi:predicted RNA-binding protein with PUA-like domain
MKAGDTVLIYHSSCAVPAIVGEAVVTSDPYPDPTQFDPASDGYDARSRQDHPRWYQADVQYVCHYPHPLTLKQIQHHPEFADMELVVRPRLSVQKVSERQLQLIRQMCQLVSATA